MAVLDSLYNLVTGGKGGSASQLATGAPGVIEAAPSISPEQLTITPAQQAVQGAINPALQTAVQQQGTNLQNIQVPGQFTGAENQAIQGLSQVAQGGLTDADRAALLDVQNQINAQTAGQRKAQLSNFQERGLGNSGVELASELMADQNAATNLNQQGTDVAGQAANRQLAALQQLGNSGAQYGQQAFQQQATQASAADLINQFNAQMKQTAQAANTGATNTAQAANIQNAQGVNAANVAAQNTAQQQSAQNALTNQGQNIQRATSAADAMNKAAQVQQGQANQIGSATTGALTGLAQQYGPSIMSGIAGLFNKGTSDVPGCYADGSSNLPPLNLHLKKGALHKMLGVSQDETIPVKNLDKAANSDSELERKRAQFAINAKKWHHGAHGMEEVPGEGDTDSVPALLTPHEAVLTKDAASRLGRDNIDHLNDGGDLHSLVQRITGKAPKGPMLVEKGPVVHKEISFPGGHAIEESQVTKGAALEALEKHKRKTKHG